MIRSAAENLALLLLYTVTVAAAARAAAWLRRPIPSSPLLLLALLPVLYLAPCWATGRTLLPADHAFFTVPDPRAGPTSVWSDDAARQFAPWARAVRLAWESGALPHRFRWSGSGMTLDGNGESAAYYPLTLAGLLLPLEKAFPFWAAARLFLCLAGFWLFLREIGVSAAASFFGAIAFAFSLAMTAWILFPHTSTLSLVPWILIAIERAADPEASARRRAFALLVFLFFLLPLSGHIETAASVCAFAAVWLAARGLTGDRPIAAASARAVAGAAAIALPLSAFSLLPQAATILASNRLALTHEPFWLPVLSWIPHLPASPWTAATLFFPRVLGDGIASPLLPGSLPSFPEAAQGYIGIVGAAVALLVARPGSPRPAAEKALLAPLVVGLGIAAGAWPFAELGALAPGLNRMLPARFLVWVALAAAAVAAFELDRLRADLETRRGSAAWPLAIFASGILAAILLERHLRPLHEAAGGQAHQRKAYLLAGLALAAAAAAVGSTSRRARWFTAAGIPLLTAAAAAELFRQGTRLTPPSDPALLYPKTPLVRFLASRPGTFRIAGEATSLFPNVGIFAGLEDVRAHDPSERRDYVEFLDATCGYDPAPYYKTIRDPSAPALDFLNVRYLVGEPGRAAPAGKWTSVYSGPDGTVFENARALPRVFAPERVRFAPSDRALATPAGFDWSREAVVRFPAPLARAAAGAAAAGADVTEYAETANAVSFRSRAPGEAVLVASLVEDGGWRARDERGTPVRIGRANGPFLALAVPAGDHRIRLEYATPGFRAGARISLAAAAVAAILAIRSRRRAREPAA